MRLFIIIFSIVSTMYAQAEAIKKNQAAPPTNPTQASPANKLTYKTMLFSKWSDDSEKRLLNLFPSFRKDASKEKDAKFEDVQLFIAKTNAAINKPAANINLANYLTKDIAKRMNQDIADLSDIQSGDVETYKQPFLNYRNPDGAKWCARHPQGLCVQSKYILDASTRSAVAVALMVVKLKNHSFDSNFDLDIRSQSEIWAEVPKDRDQIADIKKMTGVSTDPSGVFVQDVFWFNHVVEFAKVVAVLQPDPANANHTIVTGLFLFAIEPKWWNLNLGIATGSDVFLGQRLNSTTGLGRGLPSVSEALFKTFVTILGDEQQALR